MPVSSPSIYQWPLPPTVTTEPSSPAAETPVSSPPTNQFPLSPISTGAPDGAVAETPVSSPSMYQCPSGPMATDAPDADTPVSSPSMYQFPFSPICTPLPHAEKANRQARQSAVISRMRSLLFMPFSSQKNLPRPTNGPFARGTASIAHPPPARNEKNRRKRAKAGAGRRFGKSRRKNKRCAARAHPISFWFCEEGSPRAGKGGNAGRRGGDPSKTEARSNTPRRAERRERRS